MDSNLGIGGHDPNCPFDNSGIAECSKCGNSLYPYSGEVGTAPCTWKIIKGEGTYYSSCGEEYSEIPKDDMCECGKNIRIYHATH